MKTKWKLIENFCEKHGLKKAQALAKEIDEALDRLYEEKVTPDYVKAYHKFKDITLKEMDSFIGSSNYCVACWYDDEERLGGNEGTCERCPFADECGNCFDDDSLYQRFCVTFDDEVGNL